MAGVEQAQALLELGCSLEASNLANTLKAHVMDLPDDSFAAAGLLEIWRLATTGKLTTSVLRELAKALKERQERGQLPRSSTIY